MESQFYEDAEENLFDMAEIACLCEWVYDNFANRPYTYTYKLRVLIQGTDKEIVFGSDDSEDDVRNKLHEFTMQWKAIKSLRTPTGVVTKS